MEKEQLPWRSFVDPGNAGTGPIARQFNFPPTPSFYLIDHAGVIRYKWSGPPGAEALDAAIEKLVNAVKENQNNSPK
jgi:hypothetical protein